MHIIYILTHDIFTLRSRNVVSAKSSTYNLNPTYLQAGSQIQ